MEESHQLDSLSSGPSKKKILLPIAVILIVIVGVLMAIKSSVHKEAKIALQPIDLNEGSALPNFDLTRLDGSKVAVGDLPHKVMMLNFWATWCEACMEEMPSIVALREKYSAKGFEVLGVNVDENPNQVVPGTLLKLGMKFPIFTDQSNALAEMFDVHAIPLTVIIDHNRKILLVESGGRDWNEEEIQQMMDKWLSN